LKLIRNDTLGAVALIIIAIMIFYGRVPLQSATLNTAFANRIVTSPWNQVPPRATGNTLFIDPTSNFENYPYDLYVASHLRDGRFPLWDPYSGLGVPVVGNIVNAPFYPLKIILYTLPYWESYDLYKLIQYFVAGLGMYLYVRSMVKARSPTRRVGIYAPLVSAFVWMFSYRLISFMNHVTFNVEILFPWMLYFIDRYVRQREVKYLSLAGIVVGVQWLGGMPETSFIFSVVGAAYIVVAELDRLRWGLQYLATFLKRTTATLLATFGIGIGLAAINLLPFTEMYLNSFNYHTTQYGIVPAPTRDLITMFMPTYFNRMFVGYFDHFTVSAFAGVIPLVLALYGLLGRWWFEKRTVFIVSVLVIFMALDFGVPGFILIGRLPGFDLSSQAWNFWIFPFCIAVLASIGVTRMLLVSRIEFRRILAAISTVALLPLLLVQQLPANLSSTYREPQAGILALEAFLGTVLVFTIAIFVAGKIGQRLLARAHCPRVAPAKLFGCVLLVLVFSELFLQSFAFPSPSLSFERFNYPSTRSITYLQKHLGTYRFIGLDGFLPADYGALFGISEVNYFSSMYPNRYLQFVGAIWPDAPAKMATPGITFGVYDSPLLDLVAVKYVVANNNTILSSAQPGKFTPVYNAEVRIWQNNNAFPRAFAVNRAFLAANDTVAPLTSGLVNLRTTVVLYPNDDCEERALSQLIRKLDDGEAKQPITTIISYTSDQVSIAEESDVPGFLFLSDTYFPGWRAYVDGRAVSIYRADFIFRAVFLDAGHHKIVFRYEPETVFLGVVIMSLTVLITIAVNLRRRRKCADELPNAGIEFA